MTEFRALHLIKAALPPLLLLGLLYAPSASAQRNNFVEQSNNMFGKPDPNSRFVVLNSGIASMANQQFGLPKDAMTFPLAGMTVFPYYQASAPLKEFLNNAMVFGMPINNFPITPKLPQVSLPATDLVRRSIPIPNRAPEKNKSSKLNIVDKKVKDEVPWMVAHEGGQAIQIPGDNEALALVTPGTMFSACASRTMVLRCGLMWIFTGARNAAVLTKDAAVVVKPFSIAAIETTWYNRLRVAALQGSAVEMQIAFDGQSDKVTLERGQELRLEENAVLKELDAREKAHLTSARPLNNERRQADSGAGSPEQQSLETSKATLAGAAPENAGDEASSPATSASSAESTESRIGSMPLVIKVPGLSGSTGQINPRKCNLLGELAAVNPPFSNPRMSADYNKMFSNFGITPQMRREEIRRQTLQKYNLATKAAVNKLGSNAAAAAAAGTGPTSFPKPLENLKTLRLKNGSLKCLESAELSYQQNGDPKIHKGEAIFIAKNPLIIHTNTFRIHMRAGSTVQLSAKDDVILVRNLGEEEPDSVKIRLGNHIFDCGVGAELIAGTSAPVIFDEMKSDGVARRNVQSTESGAAGVVVNKSEVSLTTLMQFSPLMRKIYKSPDPSDKRLVGDLMKTIVAVNMVTGSHGNYRRMSGLSGVH